MAAPISRSKIARIFVTNAAGPARLCKADAVIACIWLGQGRKLPGCLPVKLSAVHNNPANGSPMSADKLGCRVNDNIRSILNRTDQIRRPECIVDNKRNPVSVRNRCDLLNIRHVRMRIAECLNMHRSGVFLDCLLHLDPQKCPQTLSSLRTPATCGPIDYSFRHKYFLLPQYDRQSCARFWIV